MPARGDNISTTEIRNSQSKPIFDLLWLFFYVFMVLQNAVLYAFFLDSKYCLTTASSNSTCSDGVQGGASPMTPISL